MSEALTKQKPLAGCVCGAPLVCTMLFSGFEFYCLECGRHVEWLGPEKLEATEENLARLRELEREWAEEFCPFLLTGGVMKRSCAVCMEKHEPHLGHASVEEKTKHEETLARLKERANR